MDIKLYNLYMENLQDRSASQTALRIPLQTHLFHFLYLEGYYSQSADPLVMGLPEFQIYIYLVFYGHLSYGPNESTSIL